MKMLLTAETSIGRIRTMENEKNQATITMDVVRYDLRGLPYLRRTPTAMKKVMIM
jgi:hypothetical protein